MDPTTDDAATRWLMLHQPRCLGRSQDNAAGINLRVGREGDRVVGEVTVGPGGARRYAHGGAVARLLHDALEVGYGAPVLTGTPLTVKAWDHSEPVDGKRRLRAALGGVAGQVLTEASGLFVVVDPSHLADAAGGMPEHWRRVSW